MFCILVEFSLVLGRANQCTSLFFAEAAYGIAIVIFSLFLFLELNTIELTLQSDSFWKHFLKSKNTRVSLYINKEDG